MTYLINRGKFTAFPLIKVTFLVISDNISAPFHTLELLLIRCSRGKYGIFGQEPCISMFITSFRSTHLEVKLVRSRAARVGDFCEARNMFHLGSNGSKIWPFLQKSAGDIMTKKRNQLGDNSGMLVGLYNNLPKEVFPEETVFL